MNLSQSKRAIEAREWRVGYRQKRRFNSLLSDYVSVKYDDIYTECSKFYKSLDEANPETRDLTKTKAYKKWKNEYIANKETCQDIETSNDEQCRSCQVDSTSSQDVESNDELCCSYQPDSTPVEDQPDQDLPVNNPTETPEEANEIDILSATVEEILPQNSMDINDVNNIINDIINELQQDPDIQNIFEDQLVQPQYEDEDEGIGLNVQSELEAIVEPFDYNLEVEGFDF